MLSLRDFWRRHRRKIVITAGVLGGGYFLYKLYDAHKRRLADLERQLAQERESDELVKAQMQAHFENIQRIADATTLPHAMHCLSNRIAEELDLSHLTERLKKGKEQPSSLTPLEKLELWQRLKILSFTRMVVSLWAMTALSLYIRVQVNILGRHLYVDTARSLGSSQLLDDVDPIDRDDQQKFLSSADFLANYGMPALITNIQAAVKEVLEGKQLGDKFNVTTFHDSLSQILDRFMSMGSPHQWADYLMPPDTKLSADSTSDNTILADGTKFDQLMIEARAVLSSAEFGGVLEVSLREAVNTLLEDMRTRSSSGDSLVSGMPLAKLVPRVLQVGPTLVDDPAQNRYIQVIRGVPEVEVFFTLLYANMPT